MKIDGINYTRRRRAGIAKAASLGGDQDNFAVVPLTTGLNRYGRWWRSLNILVQARDAAQLRRHASRKCAASCASSAKCRRARKMILRFLPTIRMIAQFNTFTRAVRIGVAVISSIALLAAGIGIMNIMLVSVTERTREIGIRRAIGAKKRNIMTQFIMEAIVLCEVGGASAWCWRILGGNATALLLKLPPVVPLDWVIFGLAICSVVGIVFGTYPAWKAANLDPIESLRYE